METSIFDLAPYGADSYPRGVLVVTGPLADRTTDGRRRWLVAVSWRREASERPHIVYSAEMHGERRWDMHDTDPGDAALLALWDAVRYDPGGEESARWREWTTEHGSAITDHVAAQPGIYALLHV